MHITLNSLTALRVLRSIRSKRLHNTLSNRCNLIPPDPDPLKRWSRNSLSASLTFLGPAAEFSEKRPLDVLVCNQVERLQLKGTQSTFRLGAYPSGSFVDLGNGIAMSGPELLFIELARVMDPAVHLLLGMELCGCFSRDAMNPRSGNVTYGIKPATTVDDLREFAQEAHWIRGAERALETINRIVENAWSPMEAIVAALAVLPRSELGYDLWPITLNPRKELGERLSRLSNADSRVPDIMFTGTNVGLNYDGEDHFRLGEIARSAVAADRNPGDSALARELEETLADARARIVADKRRDRDLLSLGLTVFSVTKEDLEEQGGFDRVIGQVIEAIERSGARNLAWHRAAAENDLLKGVRQDFIWSLMPGSRFGAACERLKAWERIEAHEYAVEFELEDGVARVLSVREL